MRYIAALLAIFLCAAPVRAARDFDGTTGYMTGAAPTSGYPLTMRVWVAPTDTDALQTVLWLGDSTVSLSYVTIEINWAGGLTTAKMAARSALVAEAAASGGYIISNRWHCLTAVLASSTSRKLYVDGNLVATDTSALVLDAGWDRLRIGAWGGVLGASQFLDGSVRNVGIWNVALTAEQVLGDYLAPQAGLAAANRKLILPLTYGNGNDVDLKGGVTYTATGTQTNVAGGCGPSAWDPRRLGTKLRCWLDPNVVNGSTSWPDRSGNGRDFTVAAGTLSTTTLGTGNGLVFSGDDALQNATAIVSAASPWESYVVVQPTTATSTHLGQTFFDVGKNGSATHFYKLEFDILGRVRFMADDSTRARFAAVPEIEAAATTICAEAEMVSTSDHRARVEFEWGREATTTISPASLDRTTLGAEQRAALGHYFTGTIGDVVVTDALTDVERVQLRHWLDTRYDLALEGWTPEKLGATTALGAPTAWYKPTGIRTNALGTFVSWQDAAPGNLEQTVGSGTPTTATVAGKTVMHLDGSSWTEKDYTYSGNIIIWEMYAVASMDSGSGTASMIASLGATSVNNDVCGVGFNTTGRGRGVTSDGNSTLAAPNVVSRDMAAGEVGFVGMMNVAAATRYGLAGPNMRTTINNLSRNPGVPNVFRLGSWRQNSGTSQQLTGNICEVLFFNRVVGNGGTGAVMSERSRARVVRYLERWGIRTMTYSPTWTPEDVGTIAFHYKTDGSTTESEITLSGDTVTAWGDKSANAVDLTSASATKAMYSATACLNDHPTVGFSNVQRCDLFRTGYTAPTTPAVYACGVRARAGSTGIILSLADTAGAVDYWGIGHDNGTDSVALLARSTSSAALTPSVGINDGVVRGSVFLVTGAEESSTRRWVRENDRDGITSDTTSCTPVGVDCISVGKLHTSSLTTNACDMALGEVFGFTAPLTDANDVEARGYMRRRWHYGRDWNPDADCSRPTDLIALRMDANDLATVTQSSNAVSSWTDKYGRYDFVQATAGNKPTLTASVFNSSTMYGIDFDGGDMLNLTSVPFSADTSGMWHAVIFFDSNASGVTRNVMCSADTGSAATRMLMFEARDLNNGASTPSILQKENDTADNRRNAVTVTNGNAAYVFLASSGSAYSGATATSAPVAMTTIGGSNTGDWFGDCTSLDNTTIGARIDSNAGDLFLDGKIGAIFYIQAAGGNVQDPRYSLIYAFLGRRWAAGN